MSRRVSLCVPTLVVAIAFWTTLAGAQTTVVLNAADSDAIDTVIRGGSHASANYDRQPLATSAATDGAWRTLLKFNTETPIPSGARIQSATLILTVSGGGTAPRTLSAYRLRTSFDEHVATWHRRKSGYNWSAAGGDLATLYAQTTAAATVGAQVRFDITALVQGAVDAAWEVSRWTRVAIVDGGSADAGSLKQFHSSEDANTAARPRLEVVYTTGTAPPTEEEPPAGALPSGWTSGDIGAVGAAGSATYASGRFAIAGSGRDIWDTSDEFRFIYRALSGNGEVIARVETVQHTDAWTKAGVMMRESLNANARHASMFVSAGKGLAFQRRTATGQTSSHTSGGTGTAPGWVRLTRIGNDFTAYRSVDGLTWTTVGTVTVPMASTIYVGLAVVSHLDGAVANATFSDTAVNPLAATPPPPPETESSGSPATLRLLHWNVHHLRKSNDVYDPDTQVQWMVTSNADVISLNEVDSPANATAIVSRLEASTGRDWHYYYDYGIAIVSRFPIASASSCVINPAISREAVRIGIVLNGRTVHVWSAHFDAYNATYRMTEARNLVTCAAQFPEQRILAADFNAGSTTPEINHIELSYIDAWPAARALGMATNYAGNCDGCTRNGRIDYVMASRGAAFLQLVSARIFDTRSSSGVMASDHKPLLVTYSVR
jgi:endonuclease/exonuclease/phosphatase family metal-dependent hydrolase/regulation of enolase protein 1 (concanavalin A-like superfamily)